MSRLVGASDRDRSDRGAQPARARHDCLLRNVCSRFFVRRRRFHEPCLLYLRATSRSAVIAVAVARAPPYHRARVRSTTSFSWTALVPCAAVALAGCAGQGETIGRSTIAAAARTDGGFDGLQAT